jgi:hypothetical protein
MPGAQWLHNFSAWESISVTDGQARSIVVPNSVGSPEIPPEAVEI